MTAPDLEAIFRAGEVVRWHTNPDLAGTETVADHGETVFGLLYNLHPNPSRALLWWAQHHDYGEYVTGDIPGPFKARMPPAVRAWWEAEERKALEALFGELPELTDSEREWLHFCDRLDAYEHVKEKAEHLLETREWREARSWLVANAIALNVIDRVQPILGGDE